MVGAQIRGVNAMNRWMQGDRSPFTPRPTVADGIRVRTVGSTTRLICADVLDHIVEVTEAEVRETMAHLALREQIVAEGAGAVAVAALRKVHLKGRKVAVVTGGNVDSHVLQGVLKEVLSVSGTGGISTPSHPIWNGARRPDGFLEESFFVRALCTGNPAGVPG